MDFLNTPYAAWLILLAGVLLATFIMISKREKDYQAAMAQYEKDKKAYEEAVANLRPSAAAPQRPIAPSAVSVLPPQSVKLVGVEEKTAAIIMAIVCNKMGGDPSRLQFTSIRAL